VRVITADAHRIQVALAATRTVVDVAGFGVPIVGLSDDDNLWKRFIRYGQTHPGQAALGNVHFAPNSERDYDWNNPSFVLSEADDWLLNFPNFKGTTRMVNSNEWGNGDIRKHHIWWFKHFPKTIGRKNGIHNNWWQYIMDPNNILND